MKILITSGIFLPEVGGPATFASELLKRLKTAGHQVTLITYSNMDRYEIDRDYPFPIIRIVRRKNKLANYAHYFFAVLKQARQHDLVYSLDWFSAGAPAMLAAFFAGKKYGVRVGGGYIWEKYLAEDKPPVTLKDFYEKGLYKQYPLMHRVIKSVLGRAGFVVFNSNDQRILYEKYYGLDPKKLHTIFNAIPESKFGGLVSSYNAVGQERDKEIVFAGRFIKMKNVESAIQAFAKLKSQEYKLVLIGSGPTETELRALVKKLGLEERVSFKPTMPQKELYRRISHCTYVIIPSWTDVSPHQAYECLALGIPFLLTKENYLDIKNQEFLQIDPASVDDIAEKMNWLLDPEHYRTFVESLSCVTFGQSWNEIVIEHLKLFRTLI